MKTILGILMAAAVALGADWEDAVKALEKATGETYAATQFFALPDNLTDDFSAVAKKADKDFSDRLEDTVLQVSMLQAPFFQKRVKKVYVFSGGSLPTEKASPADLSSGNLWVRFVFEDKSSVTLTATEVDGTLMEKLLKDTGPATKAAGHWMNELKNTDLLFKEWQDVPLQRVRGIRKVDKIPHVTFRLAP